MDGKRQLLAAIDDPNGINEDDWICIMPLIEPSNPLWDNVVCHHGMYYIPDKYKARLKEIINKPDVTITHYGDEEDDMSPRSSKETAYNYYTRATTAYDIGDFNTALNEIEQCLELDDSPEYLAFATTIAFCLKSYIDTNKKPVEVKEIDASALKCGACNGPYHQATGHAFFVNDEFRGVACGICSGRYFAEKLKRHGWHPVGISKKSRRQKRKRIEKQQKMEKSHAQKIVALAFINNDHWPSRFGRTLDI